MSGADPESRPVALLLAGFALVSAGAVPAAAPVDAAESAGATTPVHQGADAASRGDAAAAEADASGSGTAGAAAPPARDPALAGLFASSLRIETDEGDTHRFVVYLATTPEQRRRGLMFVEELAQDHGMLFVFGPSRPLGMWMKNTILPLDMLFIRPDGTVANIARDTVPGSLDSIRSDGAVSAVLELNAGVTERLGIEAGDRVLHPMIAPR